MIKIITTEDKYGYDIHSLFKAFFPSEDVKVIVSSDGKYEADEGDKIYDIDVSVSKNDLKKNIYRMLSLETKRELPWGNLTGIRPTRIVMNLIEQDMSDEEIFKYMKDNYYTSDEKTALSLSIAHREKEILKNIDYDNGYSLYIGIPFCPTTCLYCSFTSYPICSYADIVDDYLECIMKEIDYVSENFKGKTLDTIYVGGGTPTTLLPEQIERLLGYVYDKLDVSKVKELTVESGRPDSITREKLATMKKMGVTRISVNPQTMRDKTLELIGRRHTVSQLVDSYNMAREEGFDNINMDIILGLPYETADDVRYTMEEIKKLAPDDLTVHSLAIKRGSKLAEVLKQKELKGEQKGDVFSSIKNTEEMMKIASEGALSMGLTPYYLYRQKNISGNFENTGYARPGKAGIYNILINEEVQSIVALGAGTVTKRVYGYDGRIERCDNVKDVKLYMSQIDEMIQRKKDLFS
ncbi:oxygen-independent coproporphyrinogen-3 oxidase [Butyrivibrio hungatei]|uniref:Oxygen-independent coproporphyrinogen-3 oxidase n=1 Tax=Butyrivibrio hungatei TaxID=185008 RepID=A0A1G5B353_9FIRM|nr:coproporphyrinogen dehydrogenase HemZ [Butyrivibrio hungatei]SCX84599.1 oxygen-independent coproporphyrinogen-3 oxidase [Butyrivibrio hungatei]